ncbi:MAG: LLM class flavin-dependent oxidoreductase, partial [Beijerinckiaceae bacterium]|nr:LLM class flavin-dependent oxidoreductase [Beijerinckiaceae bacterium]
TEPFTFKGKFYDCEDIDVHPKMYQKDFRPYMASFSQFSMGLAADWDWNLLLAPFATTVLFGNLGNAVTAYKEICAKKKKPVRKVKCSYFIHIGDKPGDNEKAQERMINYITMAGLRKTMSQGGTGPLPETMQYFKKIGAALNDPKKGDFDDNSMLHGSPQQIIDSLKKVEAVGIDEVILYFNFGNAPDAQVRETMHRFSEEIAPAFANPAMAVHEPA